MPLDGLGCTRATLNGAMWVLYSSSERNELTHQSHSHCWNWVLKLLPMNVEYLVNVGHYPTLNKSLLLVHTARRCC